MKEKNEKIHMIVLLLIFLWMLLFLFTHMVWADTVIPESEFDDTQFYNYCLEQADSNQDGVLQQSEAQQLTRISLDKNESGIDITSIRGIRYFENLEELTIMNCSVSDISDLTELYVLKDCYLQSNNISEVPDLSELYQLSTLVLYSNPLTTETMKALEEHLPTSVTHQSNWMETTLDSSQINQLNNPEQVTTVTADNEQNSTANQNSTESTTTGAQQNTENPAADNYRVLNDISGSGASVRGDIDEGIYFESIRIENHTVWEEVSAYVNSQTQDISGMEIYDMGLYKTQTENGIRIKVQPNGTVEVIVPMEYESGMGGRVWHQEEDGTFQELQAFLRDGEMHFYTDKFSIFVLVITKLFGGGDGNENAGNGIETSDGTAGGSEDITGLSETEGMEVYQSDVVQPESQMNQRTAPVAAEVTGTDATGTDATGTDATSTDGIPDGTESRQKSVVGRMVLITAVMATLAGTVLFTRVKDFAALFRRHG